MSSKYASKQPKKVVKQEAALPYKRRYIQPQIEVCSNCMRERFIGFRYSKCECGGTYQQYKGVELNRQRIADRTPK